MIEYITLMSPGMFWQILHVCVHKPILFAERKP